MSDFCSECGKELSSDSNYCKSCGTKKGGAVAGPSQITLRSFERRFLYGSAPKFSEASEDVVVEADSAEALRANTPFDCSRIPDDEDLVPGNCVWSSIKYPGPLPEVVLGRSFQENLLDDFWVTARPEEEIRVVLGDPIVERKAPWGSNPDEGYSLLMFTKDKGLFSRDVEVGGVWFDCYGVALSVETNISKYMN